MDMSRAPQNEVIQSRVGAIPRERLRKETAESLASSLSADPEIQKLNVERDVLRRAIEDKQNNEKKEGIFKKIALAPFRATKAIVTAPFKFAKKHPVITSLALGALAIYFGLKFAGRRFDARSGEGFRGILDVTRSGRVFGRPDGFVAPVGAPGSSPPGPPLPGLPGIMPGLESGELAPRL